MSRSVPDLEPDNGVGGAVEDAFGDKGRAYGRGSGGRLKGIFDITVNEGGFPDTCNS